jgi:hypothetical protein
MEWEKFEKKVRIVASYIWDCSAEAKEIAGIKIDCVLEIRPDH